MTPHLEPRQVGAADTRLLGELRLRQPLLLPYPSQPHSTLWGDNIATSQVATQGRASSPARQDRHEEREHQRDEEPDSGALVRSSSRRDPPSRAWVVTRQAGRAVDPPRNPNAEAAVERLKEKLDQSEAKRLQES